MPIDLKLIDDATVNASKSLQHRIQTKSQSLFKLDNFLTESLMDKLYKFFSSDCNWIPQLDSKNQIVDSRKKINWLADSVVEETHIVFENLTPIIQKIFNRTLKFDGISIWQDTTNFFVSRHSDNPKIELAIQIYLSEYTLNLGTVFECDNEIVKIDYKINNGYLMDNKAKLTHYMPIPVPADHVRYSVYAIWVKS